jgi:hypothetical protein
MESKTMFVIRWGREELFLEDEARSTGSLGGCNCVWTPCAAEAMTFTTVETAREVLARLNPDSILRPLLIEEIHAAQEA